MTELVISTEANGVSKVEGSDVKRHPEPFGKLRAGSVEGSHSLDLGDEILRLASLAQDDNFIVRFLDSSDSSRSRSE